MHQNRNPPYVLFLLSHREPRNDEYLCTIIMLPSLIEYSSFQCEYHNFFGSVHPLVFFTKAWPVFMSTGTSCQDLLVDILCVCCYCLYSEHIFCYLCFKYIILQLLFYFLLNRYEYLFHNLHFATFIHHQTKI